MVLKNISEQIVAFLIHIFPKESDVEPVTNYEGILEEIILAAMEVMTSLPMSLIFSPSLLQGS